MMEMYEYFILHGYTGLQYQTINREKGVNQVVINCVDTLPWRGKGRGGGLKK